jgi:hypothetical protein
LAAAAAAEALLELNTLQAVELADTAPALLVKPQVAVPQLKQSLVPN